MPKLVLPRAAEPSDLPAEIRFLVASSSVNPPAGEDWIHEVKHDGHRLLAVTDGCGSLTLRSRNGFNRTDLFRPPFDKLAKAGRQLVLDGEICAPDEAGRTHIDGLNEAISRFGKPDRLAFYAFDILFCEGHDVRRCSLLERKALLQRVLDELRAERIVYVDLLAGRGPQVFTGAVALGAEGIVSKRIGSLYRGGESKDWIKTKHCETGRFYISGFKELDEGRLDELRVSDEHNGELRSVGHVRFGFAGRGLWDVLNARGAGPAKKGVIPIEPFLQAEVRYYGRLRGTALRDGVFLSLVEDVAPMSAKTARAVARPAAIRSARPMAPRPPRGLPVPKENILQLLPDAVVPSPAQLERYWRSVADRALEHLGRRPLKLVRHIRGTTFYHMGSLPPIPPAVHQLRLKKRDGREGIRVWVDDLDGLLGLIEMDVVEVHPWGATLEDIERPDMLVFDLDPGEGVSWEFMVETAFRLRAMLAEDGLDSWPKLTGGKGLHVMVPVEPELTWDTAHDYTRVIAARLAATDPRRYTTSAALLDRPGRLFVDYLRNGRGTTAIGAYSPRARPGLPIAAPVTWRDVERGIRPDAYTMTSLPPVRRRRATR